MEQNQLPQNKIYTINFTFRMNLLSNTGTFFTIEKGMYILDTNSESEALKQAVSALQEIYGEYAVKSFQLTGISCNGITTFNQLHF